eukprot:SAG11_NODE_1994_length_3953_cov_2.436430_6_plen_152_part_00
MHGLTFSGAVFGDSPNFNTLGVDHFDLLSTHPPLPDSMVEDIDHLMRQRWGVLLSIDDLVAGLHKAVEDAGEIDNTYFLFSSDRESQRQSAHARRGTAVSFGAFANESAGSRQMATTSGSSASRSRKCSRMKPTSASLCSSRALGSRPERR